MGVFRLVLSNQIETRRRGGVSESRGGILPTPCKLEMASWCGCSAISLSTKRGVDSASTAPLSSPIRVVDTSSSASTLGNAVW